MATPLQNRFSSALSQAGANAGQADAEYLRRAREFNPYASVERSATGAYGLVAPQLDRAIRNYRGQAVGMGRLTTGFADEDESDIVREGRDRLLDQIMANSMSAAQMDLSNIGQMGSYASDAGGRYLGLLSAERDREMAAQQAREQRKAGRWGAIGSLAGGALGTVLGPAGSAVGSKLGGWVAGKIGG